MAAPVLGRGGCPSVWTDRSQGIAVPTRGSLLLATTNWRFLCRPHFFDFGSVAAVDRKLFRSADAWDGFSFAGSPTGEEGGGKEKPWKQRLRVKSVWGKREGGGSAQ